MGLLKDGGWAFPRSAHPGVQDESNDGMTLRDWFAGQAMTQVMRQWVTSNDFCYDDIAKRTYEFADAMIAERDKE